MRPKTIVCFEWIIFGTLLLSVLQNSSTPPGGLRSVWFRAIAYGAIALGVPQDRNLVAAIFILLILIFVLVVTLTLLVSRRRSKTAMWILIAWVVLGLSLCLVRLVQSIGGLLGLDVVRVIGAGLYFIGERAAVGLLFGPSARRWMRREDERAKLGEVFH